MLNVVVLVSGGGTNLQAIIDAVENGTITNTKIAGVISNNKNAYALRQAKKHGIANCCISKRLCRQEQHSIREISGRWMNWNVNPRLCWAGFM